MSQGNVSKKWIAADSSKYTGTDVLYNDESFARKFIPGNRANKDYTFNEFFEDHDKAVTNRMNKVASNLINRVHNDASVNRNIVEIFGDSDEVRVNSDLSVSGQGEFFANQLQQVVPFLFVDPTRGISYQTMPVVSFGGGGMSTIKTQAYGWNANWTQTYSTATENIQNVVVSPRESTQFIAQFDQNIILEWNECVAVTESYARTKRLGQLSYDSYVGWFGAIAVKFIANAKSYQLILDNLAYLGSPNANVLPQFNVLVDGTGDNGVPLVTLADVFPVSTPTSFAGLTATTQKELLAYIIQNVSRNSKGVFKANVLRIDLDSFLTLFGSTTDYLDTTALQWVLDNTFIRAIIPVPAWSEAYPNQVTMFAEFFDPQVYYFNISQPMINTGVYIDTTFNKLGMRFRSSGIKINNALGTTQFVCPRTDDFFSMTSKDLTHKDDKGQVVGNANTVMEGLIKQKKGFVNKQGLIIKSLEKPNK